MIRLALIGKNIKHSQSPEIYRQLLSNKQLRYDLIDVANETQLPTLEELFPKYDGVSITSPYKRSYLSKIHVEEQVRSLNAVNCLRSTGSGVEGTNTDFLAVKTIIDRMLESSSGLNFVILGDGAMSFMTQSLLSSMNIHFKLFSRRADGPIDQLDLRELGNLPERLVVINSCSREFVFKGSLPDRSVFWDYNYDRPEQSSIFDGSTIQYIDGLELLTLQAKWALRFWQMAC